MMALPVALTLPVVPVTESSNTPQALIETGGPGLLRLRPLPIRPLTLMNNEFAINLPVIVSPALPCSERPPERRSMVPETDAPSPLVW
jgi:hypothetical protein